MSNPRGAGAAPTDNLSNEFDRFQPSTNSLLNVSQQNFLQYYFRIWSQIGEKLRFEAHFRNL